jgi:lysophospholipase L1-like esterase
MTAEVLWLKARVQEFGGQLIIVFVPLRETVYSLQTLLAREVRSKSNAIVEVLKRVGDEADIPFVDLTHQLLERAQARQEPLYYDGLDQHPTPEGYAAIAETVAGFVMPFVSLPTDHN